MTRGQVSGFSDFICVFLNFKKAFAECRIAGTRQRSELNSPTGFLLSFSPFTFLSSPTRPPRRRSHRRPRPPPAPASRLAAGAARPPHAPRRRAPTLRSPHSRAPPSRPPPAAPTTEHRRRAHRRPRPPPSRHRRRATAIADPTPSRLLPRPLSDEFSEYNKFCI